MNIYILTKGEHPYVMIIALYSSKERAEEEKNKRDDRNDIYIEEYEVDSELTNINKDFEKGYMYGVYMNIGSGEVGDTLFPRIYGYRHPTECVIDEDALTNPYLREHAVQVAAERREEYLKEKNLKEKS
jgi:hypothetical protein